jgi:peptidoglycan hydrolase-like protein with peptidoglycan-binding domain
MTERIVTHEEIKALQRVLSDRGLYQGEIDGLFGTMSKEAVRMLQEDLGRTPTGIPDYELLLELGVIQPPERNNPMETILANVKSAWASKLNWTLAAGAVFNVLAFLGILVPTDVKDAVVVVGNGLVLIVAWIIKTWFTTAITTASAKKLQ